MQNSSKLHKAGSLQKWRCHICEFDNLALLSACQMCQTPKVKDAKQIQKQRQKKQSELAMIQCPNTSCKQLNSLSNEVCLKCQRQLFASESDDDQKEDEKIDKDLIICTKCSFKNSPQNAFCVNCQKKLKKIRTKSIRPKKAGARYRARYGVVNCPKCGSQVRTIDFTTGETDICMTCQQKNPFVIRKYLCLFCDKKLTSQEKQHDNNCKERKIFYSKTQSPTYERCTDLQYQTMVYMHNKCQKLHYRKENVLVERIKKLGYSQKDLENLHHYIIHYAPIIIHMHVNTHFHFFLKDTHYRNQFQTSMSSGSLSHSARTGWEDRMFDRKHHSATGFERVKYGTMNFTNDPSGVRACLGYGQSYFLLKKHVRDRCTITDMDSSASNATLGTFRFIFHLLMKLSDAQLKSAFEGSKGKQMLSNVIGAYKQIQIHGPVQFSKDVERLYISKEELKLGDAKALLQQVKSFCSKNNIDYQLFQNDTSAVLPVGQKVPQRIVGSKKQLTEDDLKPPPPTVLLGPIGFGAFGGGFAGFGLGKPAVIPASSFGFGSYSPFSFAPPKPPEKKKEYGVDYI